MAWHPTWNDDSDRGGRYRQVRMGWQGGRRGTPGLWWILGLTIFAFLVLQGGSLAQAVDEYGPLTAEDLFLKGQVWRLVTFQFLHSTRGIDHILFNMFFLWMFGRIVEMQIGTRRFVWLYLLCGVTGGLAEGLFNVIMTAVTGDSGWMTVGAVGASAGVMGITIAFAMLNPNAPILLFFILPIPAKWLAVGYFVLESWPILGMITSRGQMRGDNVAHAAHVGGMIYAFAWAVLAGFVKRPWAHRWQAAFDRFTRSFRAHRSSRAVRRDHPVVRGPNADAAGPSARPRTRDDERLDEILRKIHDKGLLSLTDAEREFLRDMSQRKQDGRL